MFVDSHVRKRTYMQKFARRVGFWACLSHIKGRVSAPTLRKPATLLLVSSPVGYYSLFVGKRQALFPKVKEFSSPQGCAAGGLRLHRKSPLWERALCTESGWNVALSRAEGEHPVINAA